MSHYIACPDLSYLSQFIDQELEGEEADNVLRHVTGCTLCTERIRHINETEQSIKTELRKSRLPKVGETATADCLSPEQMSAFLQRILPTAMEDTVELHLQHCDLCLDEVRHTAQIMATLASPDKEPVPTTLRTQVTALWDNAVKKGNVVSLSRVVLQIGKKGLKLVERYLTPPLLDIQEVFVSLPAYRADEMPQRLDLRIQTGELEIYTSTFAEGPGVSLKMLMRRTTQEVFSGQRIFLRQDGRSIFSAKTDNQGILQTPHLEPGTYEVTCAGGNVSFLIELLA
jgi:hypothetical protein